MRKTRAKFTELFKRSPLGTPDNFIPFLATLVLIVVATAGSILFWHKDIFSFFFGFDVITLGFSALVLMTAVGAAGMRALVKVSAGLSLVVFLAESYCGPDVVRTTYGDNALRLLLIIAFVYLVFDFFKVFYRGIAEYVALLATEKRLILLKWLVALFFIAVVVIFLGTLFEVMRPIILGLCVYR